MFILCIHKMVEVTIDTILYMSYKLAPFMIISFFSFYSLLMKDFKGIILLCGILFSCFITIVFSNTFFKEPAPYADTTKYNDFLGDLNDYRNDITLSEADILKKGKEIASKITINHNKCAPIFTLSNKAGPVSNLPLSINIFAFLLAYFFICMGYYNLFASNGLVVFIHISLLLYDIYFTSIHSCSTTEQITASLLLGFVFGIMWYYMIDSLNNPELQFFNNEANSDSCKRENTQFACRLMVKLDS
jgi:hypothetical protein